MLKPEISLHSKYYRFPKRMDGKRDRRFKRKKRYDHWKCALPNVGPCGFGTDIQSALEEWKWKIRMNKNLFPELVEQLDA
tara:strand:+ start:549 stop:788 length:240 start_codon:yes stop_codon:yes gene_type:complete